MHTFENLNHLGGIMAKILMITATSDNNRALAEKFADSAREMGHEADVIDLSLIHI